MNTFSRYLFQTLFSWTHEAIRQLSRPDILDSWLATHWLSIVLFLMVAGTVIDFAVWLVRWRPDLVWRGSLSRSASAFRAEERQMRRFRKGFKQNNAEIGAIAQPRQDAPMPEPYQDAPEAEQAAEDEGQDALYDLQFAAQAEAADTGMTRHRRSERYRHRGKRVAAEGREKGEETDAEEASMYGLPPIVRKEQAFRAPVYPQNANKDQRP